MSRLPPDLARHQSNLARARLWGMKYRAEVDPPRAAVGGFPYPARTCAEWVEEEEFDGRTLLKAVTAREATNALRLAA